MVSKKFLIFLIFFHFWGGANTVDKHKTHMKLTIKLDRRDDFGAYQCRAKNTKGETDGTINVYPLGNSGRHRTTRAPSYKHKNRKNSLQKKLLLSRNNTGTSMNITYLDSNELEPFSSYDDEFNDGSSPTNISISLLISFCLISFCT